MLTPEEIRRRLDAFYGEPIARPWVRRLCGARFPAPALLDRHIKRVANLVKRRETSRGHRAHGPA